ncbi:hypothetical protein [Gordonia sp. NPDC003429]
MQPYGTGRPDPQHAPAGSVPEYWLTPGPMLPRRSWQHKTRIIVIMVTTIAAALFAAVAVLALGVGHVSRTHIDAKGEVVVDCGTWSSTGIAENTPVRIYEETGEQLATARLDRRVQVSGECRLAFEIAQMPVSGSGYVVRVGDDFSQPVSSSALRDGVVLRPAS